MTYHHLSREERYQISALLKDGLNQSEIALNLGRHKTTIRRVIARNLCPRGYCPKQASFLAEQRSICSRNARQIHLQIGHWEGDTLIGKSHKQAIVSLVERKSGYAVLAKVQNKTAYQVSNAIIIRLKRLKITSEP